MSRIERIAEEIYFKRTRLYPSEMPEDHKWDRAEKRKIGEVKAIIAKHIKAEDIADAAWKKLGGADHPLTTEMICCNRPALTAAIQQYLDGGE